MVGQNLAHGHWVAVRSLLILVELMQEILNLKIKRRGKFPPFAPSILKEYVGEYFELDQPVPFMEKVFPIKESKRSEIPAVTHVDGTGRLQSVDKNVSPKYYALIETFGKNRRTHFTEYPSMKMSRS